MKYVHDNARKELSVILRSIGKDVDSWAGWTCLHVEAGAAARSYDRRALHKEIHDILDRHFGEGGIAFFVEDLDIYAFCKDVATPVIDEAGAQIARHIHEKTGAKAYDAHWALMPEMPLPEEEPPQAGAFVKVLLVEDDPVTRWMVRAALKDQCTLVTASTGGTAIETYHKCRPDLVFLDINLPDKSGREVLKDIFKDDPKANVVVFSSYDNVETMVSMLETGACGFISKPFTRQRLLTYVKRSSVN